MISRGITHQLLASSYWLLALSFQPSALSSGHEPLASSSWPCVLRRTLQNLFTGPFRFLLGPADQRTPSHPNHAQQKRDDDPFPRRFHVLPHESGRQFRRSLTAESRR